MFEKSDRTKSRLKSLFLALLLLAPSAYAEKFAEQQQATEKRLNIKKTERDKKPLNQSAAKNIEIAEQKLKQARQVTGEDLNCEDSSCNERQSALQPNTPLGARISDALTRQDREAAVEILEHNRLLLNDEMNLLYLAGRKNQAADIAFVLMDRASLDESLYEQAAPILMANARTSGVVTTFHSFDSYSAINTEIATFGHPLGRLKYDLSFHQESRSKVDTALLTTAPNEGGAEVALHQYGDSYVNTLRLNSSEALNTQNGMSFNHQHQIGSRLKLDALLAYNQMAGVSAAMRIMGRNSQVALESSYSLDNSNQWIMSGGYNRYQSIDGEELGSGKLLSSTLSHELSGVHPALRARLTGTWSQFASSGQTLSGNAASLIPAGANNTADYFMPQDVSEIALYVSAGDATGNKAPARSLEYHCEVGGFDNPSAGPGWRASAGVAGRVIGADRLHLFIRYDQSASGQGFSSLEAGLAYLLFY